VTGKRHVFLHAGWRTSSTYVWGTFRALPDVLGYMEPFNEALASLDESSIATNNEVVWASGHPRLDRPYFAEYAPLIEGRGVRGFDLRFGYRQFFAPDEEPSARPYIQSLLDAAHARGRVAVLGFCRSTARTGWMREHFPTAAHIFQRRSLEGQLSSCRAQLVRHNNPYFLAVHYLLLTIAPADSIGARIRERVSVPDLSGLPILDQFGQCQEMVREGAEERDRAVFTYIYAYCDWHSRQHADLVLDIDALSADVGYRGAMQQRIEELCGMRPSFGDAAGGDRRIAPAAGTGELHVDVAGWLADQSATEAAWRALADTRADLGLPVTGEVGGASHA
jgi:hypothetical protein